MKLLSKKPCTNEIIETAQVLRTVIRSVWENAIVQLIFVVMSPPCGAFLQEL